VRQYISRTAVEVVYQVAVFFVHDAAFDFECGRQFAAVYGEFCGKQDNDLIDEPGSLKGIEEVLKYTFYIS
jgi:hypothetical protein